MKEAQTRWLNFRNKNIDLMVLTKDHFPLALDNTGDLNEEFVKDDIRLQIAPTLTYWWLAFNMQHPILGKNVLIRKAIGHAVNIDEYIKSFTNNIALKANSIYPPGVNGYSPANELPYKYDVPMAKKLLAEAGFPNGKGLPEFTYDVRGSTTVSRQMGEFIEKELGKIGIQIKVILNSFPGFLNKAKTGQLQIWQGGWAMDYPDPENVIQLLITKNHPPGPNSTLYSNPKVDKLYKELFHAKESEDVQKVTKKVEELVSKDLPWIMQFYSRNYILHHGYLKNFRQSDLVNNNFKYLKLE
jgi:ABC-type transport system substrate-binding protein